MASSVNDGRQKAIVVFSTKGALDTSLRHRPRLGLTIYSFDFDTLPLAVEGTANDLIIFRRPVCER